MTHILKNLYYIISWIHDLMKIFSVFIYYHIMYHVLKWIEKWIILRSSCFSEHKRKEFMMHLYFLSINKNYRSHTFLDLINKIQFQKKWIKIQVLINNKCELISIINIKYVQKQHLKIWKLEYNMILRNFNKKIIWITYLIIMKL